MVFGDGDGVEVKILLEFLGDIEFWEGLNIRYC